MSAMSTSSVISGWISLIEPTVVVFAAPNPPAMMILHAIGRVTLDRP
jgi:hypothetical protein